MSQNKTEDKKVTLHVPEATYYAVSVHPQMTKQRFMVYDYLAKNGPASIAQIEEALASGGQRLSARLSELNRQGYVKCVGLSGRILTNNRPEKIYAVVDRVDPIETVRPNGRPGLPSRTITPKKLLDDLIEAAEKRSPRCLSLYTQVLQRLEEHYVMTNKSRASRIGGASLFDTTSEDQTDVET